MCSVDSVFVAWTSRDNREGKKSVDACAKVFHNPKLFHTLTASQIALTSGCHFNAIRLVAQARKKKVVAHSVASLSPAPGVGPYA